MSGEISIASQVEKELYRRTIGRFATGVTVITTRHDGRNYGMTASAVTSLSLEPPMLLVCVNKRTWVHDAVRGSNVFAVNVLALGQDHIARQFAQPAEDKFAGVPFDDGVLGVPVLREALAHFECRVTDRITGGTHTVFLGEVLAVGATDREPLLYYCGQFGGLALPESISA